MLAEIDAYEEQVDRKSVSLVESVRREEMEEAEARRSNLYAHATGDSSENPEGNDDEGSDDEEERRDLYLIESARIMSDLIDLDDGLTRIAHRNESRTGVEIN